MSLRQYAHKASSTIMRTGESYNVVRRSESGTDRYGGETYSWSSVGTVVGVLFYGSRDRQLRAEESGRLRSDRPSLMASHTADLEEDDRVLITGTEYRVDSIKRYMTHVEASLRAVTP